MKSSEWLRVCDQVNNLWPAKPWTAQTASASVDLFESVSAQAAHDAVRRLAEEGREFAPSPSVLLVHAQASQANLHPALPAPDLIRDLTPEEQERARDMAYQLRAKITELAKAKSLRDEAHTHTKQQPPSHARTDDELTKVKPVVPARTGKA
jgi:hypothetical protein